MPHLKTGIYCKKCAVVWTLQGSYIKEDGCNVIRWYNLMGIAECMQSVPDGSIFMWHVFVVKFRQDTDVMTTGMLLTTFYIL